MNSLMLPKYESCVSVNNKPATSAKGTDSCQENANNKTHSNMKTHSKKKIWPDGVAEQQSLSTDMELTMEVTQCPALQPIKVRQMIYWFY